MRRRAPLPLCIALAASLAVSPASASHTTTRRLPIGSAPSNGGSWETTISAGGRFAAFVSRGSNLVPGDTNGQEDIFVVDLATNAVERASVSSAGDQANGWSGWPAISADGRYVAFYSQASNLVPGDTNVSCDWDYNGVPDNCPDVFVRDRVAGTTERVSVASDGGQANNLSGLPGISSDGRWVGFGSSASNLDARARGGVFLHDRATGLTELVSVTAWGEVANGSSDAPSISGDGRFVAFQSLASNLVAGDTNGRYDVYVKDRVNGAIERMSLSSSGGEFTSDSEWPDLSDDGRWVAFVGGRVVPRDLGNGLQVWVRDRLSGEMVLVTRAWTGGSSRGDLGALEVPRISADGRWVLYSSFGDDLVPGDTNGARDTFVFDLATRRTFAVSVDDQGDLGNSHSTDGDISGDGRLAVFQSWATNLDPGPAPFHSYIILRDRGVPTCLDGAREEGRLSSRLHDLEEPAGPAGFALHEVGCSATAHGF